MKDILIKINRKKLNAFDVITTLCIETVFYDWLKKYDPLLERIYSLKRLAKIFLADFPSYYEEYDKKKNSLEECIRIARTPVYEED